MNHILLPTKVHLKNVYYLFSACSNLTNVVLVIVLGMIIGKGVWYLDRLIWSMCNHSSNYEGNHLDNISEIGTRAIESKRFWDELWLVKGYLKSFLTSSHPKAYLKALLWALIPGKLGKISIYLLFTDWDQGYN